VEQAFRPAVKELQKRGFGRCGTSFRGNCLALIEDNWEEKT